MADIVTPALGESVSEATVARWTKKAGDAVKKDEVLVELETDKVSLEVGAPADGVLAEILTPEGATITPGAKLGTVSENGAAAPAAGKAAPAAAPKAAAPTPTPVPTPTPAPVAARAAGSVARAAWLPPSSASSRKTASTPRPCRRTGKDGRITKGDALAAPGRPRQRQPAPAPAPQQTRPRA